MNTVDATKAIWTVTAGVILEQPEANVTKSYVYTAQAFEADQDIQDFKDSHFCKLLVKANAYAMELQNPAFFNWVKTSFIWL